MRIASHGIYKNRFFRCIFFVIKLHIGLEKILIFISETRLSCRGRELFQTRRRGLGQKWLGENESPVIEISNLTRSYSGIPTTKPWDICDLGNSVTDTYIYIYTNISGNNNLRVVLYTLYSDCRQSTESLFHRHLVRLVSNSFW